MHNDTSLCLWNLFMRRNGHPSNAYQMSTNGLEPVSAQNILHDSPIRSTPANIRDRGTASLDCRSLARRSHAGHQKKPGSKAGLSV